jgi:hypothetical protein
MRKVIRGWEIREGVMNTSQPRISANELGKFVFSTDSEKRRILRDQKFPKPIKVSYYQSASSAILRSFEQGAFSRSALLQELNRIQAMPGDTPHKERLRRGNTTAIRRFLTIYDRAAPPDGEHSIIRRDAHFVFEGIDVSVRPDIRTWNKQEKFFTYSKLRISSDKYSLDASGIVLLLIQKFAEEESFEGLGFDASRARLIDCFSQQVFQGHDVSPFKGRQLMKALAEINALWPFIKPN